jgi:large subunit ribosomal protein L3
MLGHFAASKVAPKKEIVEFRVRDETGLTPIGSMITPSWFKEGQFVDTRSNCKGKGFAGVGKAPLFDKTQLIQL